MEGGEQNKQAGRRVVRCTNSRCPSTKREHRGVEWPAEARAVSHAKKPFSLFLISFLIALVPPVPDLLLLCPSTKREHRGVEWPAEARAVSHAKKPFSLFSFFFLLSSLS